MDSSHRSTWQPSSTPPFTWDTAPQAPCSEVRETSGTPTFSVPHPHRRPAHPFGEDQGDPQLGAQASPEHLALLRRGSAPRPDFPPSAQPFPRTRRLRSQRPPSPHTASPRSGSPALAAVTPPIPEAGGSEAKRKREGERSRQDAPSPSPGCAGPPSSRLHLLRAPPPLRLDRPPLLPRLLPPYPQPGQNGPRDRATRNPGRLGPQHDPR